MSARADSVPLPEVLVRRLFSPTAGLALVVLAAAALLRHRLTHISVPPMSDAWLSAHASRERHTD